jgi:hypothetical protein
MLRCYKQGWLAGQSVSEVESVSYGIDGWLVSQSVSQGVGVAEAQG